MLNLELPYAPAILLLHQNRQIHRNRKHISGCQGMEGGGKWEVILNDYGGYFWSDENVLNVDSCTNL